MPGRIDFDFVAPLEKLFAGRKVTWLIEENSTHEPTLRNYLEKSGSGAMFDAGDAAPAAAGTQLSAYLADGGVLIFVPSRTNARLGTACHIPASHLQTLCAFGLPILPIAVDRPQESCLSVERKANLPSAVISIGKLISSKNSSVANYQQYLLEANEEAYSLRTLLDGSLPIVLLEGLKK